MSVVGFPQREPERWVSRAEMAEIMGISVDTLDRLRKDGLPTHTWSKRTPRFLPSEVIVWAVQHNIPNEGLRAA